MNTIQGRTTTANTSIDLEYKINPFQVKNPVWKSCKFQTTIDQNQIADFILAESRISIIFLSLSYYYEYPLYLKAKVDDYYKSQDYKNFPNRILLLLMDRKDINDFMTDVVQLCYIYDIKVLCGFSYEDIGNYLRSFKLIQKDYKYHTTMKKK